MFRDVGDSFTMICRQSVSVPDFFCAAAGHSKAPIWLRIRLEASPEASSSPEGPPVISAAHCRALHTAAVTGPAGDDDGLLLTLRRSSIGA